MLRIVLAQLNLRVGDIAGNTRRIIDAARIARDQHRAQLVAFPELAITGYPPEDLVLRPGFLRQAEEALQELRGAVPEIALVVGHPEYESGCTYNACSWIERGEIRAVYRKQALPNYAVFDEKRYFTPGDHAVVVDHHGVRIALTICEDIWQPSLATQARDAGAQMILNLNASPYDLAKRQRRIDTLRQAVAAGGLPVTYLNLVGGQDELVFDGGSLAMNGDGTLAASGVEFDEQLLPIEVRPGAGGCTLSGPSHPPSSGDENIYRALVLGVRDYVGKNGFKGAVLGLSGGIDSALTLALGVDALGADNVSAVMMPSRYTADISLDDAQAQARLLGCRYDVVSIAEPVQAFGRALAPVFGDAPADTTEENIQARCRGLILMAISNKTGRIVLATGNKSEMAVGYATLYGDMAGGFAPLKDIFKTLVFRLARYRNTLAPAIPERVITRPPTAELRPNQFDTDSLPPYEILDPILEQYIEQDRTPREISAQGFDPATVARVVRMVDRNEYKRRQAAPGIRVTTRAFGRDRRYPITSCYTEVRDDIDS